MLIETYFQQFEGLMSKCSALLSSEITRDKRSPHIGFIEGRLTFIDGSSLHLAEFVNLKVAKPRYKYSYHYQDSNQRLVFRYDMAHHHPEVDTFPHHKHLADGRVESSHAPTFSDILNEIETHLA